MAFIYNPFKSSVTSPSNLDTLIINPYTPSLQKAGDAQFFWFRVPVFPEKIIRVLSGLVASLVGLHIMTQAIKFSFASAISSNTLTRFFQLFDLDQENNFPSLFSFGLLALSSGLLYLIAFFKSQTRSSYYRHWGILALLMGALSLDEIMSFHELLVIGLRKLTHASGLFHFAWVIPGMIFVLAVGIGFVSFLRALPQRTRRLFLLAGSIYIGGALGMEMIGGLILSFTNPESPLYLLEVTVEETLEMTGIVVFIHALLTYLQHRVARESFT